MDAFSHKNFAKFALGTLLTACGGIAVTSGVTGMDVDHDAAATHTDGGAVDANSPRDASLDHDEGTLADANVVVDGSILCGTTRCDLANNVCCEPSLNADGGAPFCASSCPNQWGTVECEKAADCASGSYCCGGRGLNSAMYSRCTTTACKSGASDIPQLCADASECASGSCELNTPWCGAGRKVCSGTKFPGCK